MIIFHPKILDSFKGYNRSLFTKDVLAGITVGIVALPLAMAFAIASGLKPEAGIFTAIVAGGLISISNWYSQFLLCGWFDWCHGQNDAICSSVLAVFCQSS